MATFMCGLYGPSGNLHTVGLQFHLPYWLDRRPDEPVFTGLDRAKAAGCSFYLVRVNETDAQDADAFALYAPLYVSLLDEGRMCAALRGDPVDVTPIDGAKVDPLWWLKEIARGYQGGDDYHADSETLWTTKLRKAGWRIVPVKIEKVRQVFA